MEEESPDSIAASREESDTFHGGTVSREDYVHSEPQPGTSELCERLQRYVLDDELSADFSIIKLNI